MFDNKEIDPALQILAWIGIALFGVLLLIVGAIAVTLTYLIVKIFSFLIKSRTEKGIVNIGAMKKAITAGIREVASSEEYDHFRKSVSQLPGWAGAAAIMAIAHFIDNDPRVDELLQKLPGLRKAALKAGAVAAVRGLLG